MRRRVGRVGALYKGLLPNIGRGMTMNAGMMSFSDQAKEVCVAFLKVRTFVSPLPRATRATL